MKQNFDYSIVFPCLNCVDFTKQFIDSMLNDNQDFSRLVAVNNGSSDGTAEYLSELKLGGLITNKKNYGFGVPLNQGAMALQTEWTVFANNDIIVTPNWVENLLSSAEKNNLSVICPSIIEEELDYDLKSTVKKFKKNMSGYVRYGDAHAVCIAIHESIWDKVGFFRAQPSLFGFEDKIFFNALKREKINIGITSDSWIHHFGSVTQKTMKKDLGIDFEKSLVKSDKNKELCRNFLLRKIDKFATKRTRKKLTKYEVNTFGNSVLLRRINGNFDWDY